MLSGSSFIHQHLSAEDARKLLLAEGQNGSFLVRPSRHTPGNFSLSVKQDDQVIHVKIQNCGDHYELRGEEEYATLTEMVFHLIERQFLIMQKDGPNLTLKEPLCVSEPSMERWYHGRMDGKEAEAVLLERTRTEGCFLIRDSQTQPGDFVLSARDAERGVTHIMIHSRKNKFEIDGQWFVTLNQLVDHYRNNDIVFNNKKAFRLTQALNMSRIQACDIGQRMLALAKEFLVRNKPRNGFWEEFQHLEQMEVSTVSKLSRTVGMLPENRVKNRYNNILPFDHCRVVLRIDGDPSVAGSDYINANYINAEFLGMTKRYIGAQGCLQNTVGDMWRMIWQEDCRIIVMTTQLVERGRMKCAHYWPDEEQKLKRIEVPGATYVVKHVKRQQYHDYNVNVLELTREEGSVAEGKKSKRESKRCETRTVYHYNFLSWPDKYVPRDPRPILGFIDDINNRQISEKITGPVLVHCSAGIGRTGTYILIDVITSQIQLQGLRCEIDISQTLSELRTQRSGIVQTESQYEFAYTAVRQFVEVNYRESSGNHRPPPGKEDLALYANIPAETNCSKKCPRN